MKPITNSWADKIREEFEEWRDKNGGWPSRTECGEWFISKSYEEIEKQMKKEMEKRDQMREVHEQQLSQERISAQESMLAEIQDKILLSKQNTQDDSYDAGYEDATKNIIWLLNTLNQNL